MKDYVENYSPAGHKKIRDKTSKEYSDEKEVKWLSKLSE